MLSDWMSHNQLTLVYKKMADGRNLASPQDIDWKTFSFNKDKNIIINPQI